MGQKTLTDTMKILIIFYLMKLNKPKFWDKKIVYFNFIIPFHLLYYFNFFKKKFTKIKFNIPIICVGNIYIGELVKLLLQFY